MTSQLLSAEFKKSLETAVSRYETALQGPEGAVARDYLSGRGLSPSVVSDYRLGLVDADSPDHSEYVGWISIPYLTRGGVCSIKLRNLSGYGKKYVNPGYESRLYNTKAMDAADRTGILCIAEGEIDAITLTALCGLPAVGIPGVDSYKAHPEWRELFRAYQQVLIFEDQDEPQTRKVGGVDEIYYPGRELSKKLRGDVDSSRIVRLPTKDVNDCYMEHGRDGVLQAAGLL